MQSWTKMIYLSECTEWVRQRAKSIKCRKMGLSACMPLPAIAYFLFFGILTNLSSKCVDQILLCLQRAKSIKCRKKSAQKVLRTRFRVLCDKVLLLASKINCYTKDPKVGECVTFAEKWLKYCEKMRLKVKKARIISILKKILRRNF